MIDQGTERAVVYLVMDAVAGARRTPGRHETGVVPPKSPATTLLSLWPSAFWDFGSLHQRRRGVISYALSRQPCLRLCRCGDFGFVSRHRPAEHRIPDVSAAPTLRRHTSRPVAAACTLLWKTLRRHSMSAVAAQLPCPPMILPSGVILPPRLPGGARVRGGLRSPDGDSIPLLSAPIQKIIRDRGDHGTLAPQMGPEDTYSQFRSPIPGMLLSMSAALESRSSDGERSPFHKA